ncbi:outer membrane transport energization protein ExbD [Sphingomonas sp. PP-CE-1A-559]|jgi:biopolymer transport protein ExbD|uniref:ExbD/TolR family protein n=1 Tax=Sphingomonas TaxID=13687 RepID=UPI0007003029|nr:MULTISPECIES: biopolymer transporter ExbD [unclassified Sphingomonas]KQM56548.1 biopolymer transporter ExbD [Sphingomonas sp. Leaf208]KQN05742.1 biopolymer transporter ExbD [Sphingomonas sp. Leaf230]MDD1450696.1 biopolymer transporter ExbD [Sphingomonas sp. H160509]RKE50117.1 outer membrane transport energization protein ExbD [Sphingomonas sp. PP-CC-1A-547]TCM08451.1 outer membrane transport energization protein ExbD [Sphingomonas sp. PP-CC-3G-468]
MAMSGGKEDGAPMMEMNMTPLIDVLLVLLIMFIITIPIQTHAVKVDLPVNSKNQPQNPVDPQKNKISIDPAGTVAWNGSPVDEVTLRQYLDQSAGMTPEPELHFQPDPESKYEVVDRTLAVIKRSAITKLGFIGNEQYRNAF